MAETRPWEKGLRNASIFLCLITRHYLRSPEGWEQVALARRLHKPCIALIQRGTHVPEGFLDGFVDLEIHYFEGLTDLARLARMLKGKLGPGALELFDGGV